MKQQCESEWHLYRFIKTTKFFSCTTLPYIFLRNTFIKENVTEYLVKNKELWKYICMYLYLFTKYQTNPVAQLSKMKTWLLLFILLLLVFHELMQCGCAKPSFCKVRQRLLIKDRSSEGQEHLKRE